MSEQQPLTEGQPEVRQRRQPLPAGFHGVGSIRLTRHLEGRRVLLRDGGATTGSIQGAILALVFACLMALAPSLASASWSSPAVVSGVGTSTSQAQVAGDQNGTSWVIWKREVGGFDVIQGTKVSVEGTQGPIVTISDPAANATNPTIASRADGSAMVAWINTSTADDSVASATIAADGTVGAATARSAPGPAGQPASDVSVALGADGSSTLTWRKFDGTDWIAQGVRVAANGVSGTIHNLSDAGISVGPPRSAAIPNDGGDNAYRTIWPQGAGDDSNVVSRDLNADDTLAPAASVYLSGAACPDPFDTYVVYGSDESMSAFWVCNRPGLFPTDGSNWTAQWLRLNRGIPITPGANVLNASPEGTTADPYTITSLYANGTFGGQPVAAWVHALNGGGERVETWRMRPNGADQRWENVAASSNTVLKPVIVANSSGAAVAAGVDQGPAPGQSSVSLARFSFSAFEPLVPSGSFVYSDDPGFAMANNGKALGAFTGIDGSSIGSTFVMTYEEPGLAVDPGSFQFGRVDIGRTNRTSVTVRSTGQTPVNVSGIAVSGPGASSYTLDGANQCVREYAAGGTCRFEVAFKPDSTAVRNATVTVTSDAGNDAVNLTGSGLNRTRNQITATPRNASARKGKFVRIAVKASNRGFVTSNSTRICVNLNKRALKLVGNRCRTIGGLPAGATRNLNYRVRVTWRVRKGSRLPVTFLLRSNNTVVRQAVVNVRRKGN